MTNVIVNEVKNLFLDIMQIIVKIKYVNVSENICLYDLIS